MRVAFRALEYCADRSLRASDLELEGSREHGWTVRRGGRSVLELGPGYRLLSTSACGVCSTDLARHFLPFPLPQVTGHEVVARDEHGRACVVEINASHAARGVDADCPFCRAGLERHCPERLVLGIDSLPGGFGPWILAPERAVLPIPAGVPESAAVLVEPFAAVLNAVDCVRPRAGDTIAVLGPRRLGLLAISALAAHRADARIDFEILALSRHAELAERALAMGATAARVFGGDGAELPDSIADVVIDTTGSPAGAELALRLARREVHLKSTHGREALGLAHTTEMVVDELAIEPLPASLPIVPSEHDEWARSAWHLPRAGKSRPTVAWLAPVDPPAWLTAHAELLRGSSAAELLTELESRAAATNDLPRADAAVVDSLSHPERGADAAIRPRPRSEVSLVRPRGAVLLHPSCEPKDAPLVRAVVDRGLRLSTSRCGDFRRALALLASRPELCALGERLVTHRFPASELERALAVARSPECIKAVVEHPAAPR